MFGTRSNTKIPFVPYREGISQSIHWKNYFLIHSGSLLQETTTLNANRWGKNPGFSRWGWNPIIFQREFLLCWPQQNHPKHPNTRLLLVLLRHRFGIFTTSQLFLSRWRFFQSKLLGFARFFVGCFVLEARYPLRKAIIIEDDFPFNKGGKRTNDPISGEYSPFNGGCFGPCRFPKLTMRFRPPCLGTQKVPVVTWKIIIPGLVFRPWMSVIWKGNIPT